VGLISFVIAKLIWNATTKKYNKQNLKNEELKFAQNCIDYLSIHPRECKQYFLSILPNSASDKDFIVCGKTLYYINYACEQVDTATIGKILEKLDEKKFDSCKLFCNNLSPKAREFIVSMQNITYIDSYNAYLLMKSANKFPITQQKNAKMQRAKWKNNIKMAFCRKKAKPYLIYGALLLATSFIMDYKFLYCFFGSVSVIFGIICLVIKNNTDQILS
jgi:hypothetical protein